jgi:hypothetical protein
MKVNEEQIKFTTKFGAECIEKAEQVVRGEVEIDPRSLLIWFTEYAFINKMDEHALHNFKKIFAELIIFDVAKDSLSVVSVEEKNLKILQEFVAFLEKGDR